jgi:hypothetical protein
VLTSGGHVDFDVGDHQIVPDRPNVDNALRERPAGELVKHLGPLLDDRVTSLEVRYELRDRRQEVPSNVLRQHARICVECPADDCNVVA